MRVHDVAPVVFAPQRLSKMNYADSPATPGKQHARELLTASEDSGAEIGLALRHRLRERVA